MKAEIKEGTPCFIADPHAPDWAKANNGRVVTAKKMVLIPHPIYGMGARFWQCETREPVMVWSRKQQTPVPSMKPVVYEGLLRPIGGVPVEDEVNNENEVTA